MLSADETYASLAGAWRLMLGKVDGLRLLDLSADGFWNSFFAIVV
ncbi:MAG: transporter, partial [Mesorhizobium sp.]